VEAGTWLLLQRSILAATSRANVMGDFRMEDTAGWKVAIAVPQPNGGLDHHLWVAAIPDEEEVRARLWLWQIPCEAQFTLLRPTKRTGDSPSLVQERTYR